MADFINVPVPAHLVVEVMKFIASFADPSKELTVLNAEGSPVSSSWSRSELEVIHAHRSSMPSVELFAQVLSQLTEIAPEKRSRDDIAAALGEDGLTMVKKFGAVTRFINKRIPSQSNTWPMVFGDNSQWGMDEKTAQLWKSVASGASDG